MLEQAEDIIFEKEREATRLRDEKRKKDELKRIEESKQISAWTSEELALLTKAVVKFPGGVPNRWKVIADYIGSKNVKEVIAKAKEISDKRN